MSYSPEDLVQLAEAVRDVLAQLQSTFLQLTLKADTLLSRERAREFAQHGLARRLGILRRCIENIYAIFPPGRRDVLSHDELSDVAINLHSFVINIEGVQDNIAWVYVLEHGLEDTIGSPTRIGLFKRETQRHLPEEVREYLRRPATQQWHEQHAKDYRDALAHRIPLYVPPFEVKASSAERYRQLDREAQEHLVAGNLDAAANARVERDALASPCIFFKHSLSQEDPSQPIALHPQLVADSRTVLEIIALVFKHLRSAA